MGVRFSARTNVGLVRGRNEDNFLVDTKLQLFIVCDGMGGHNSGDVASATSVNVVRDTLLKHRADLESYRRGEGGLTQHEVLTLLEQAVKSANQRVYERGMANEEQRGMGTTLSALLVLGSHGFSAHVGDSRLYRCRAGHSVQLTQDHSFYEEMARHQPSVARDLQGNFKNAITRAVGARPTVEVDVTYFPLEADDCFLLSTDGLHGYFADDDPARFMSIKDLDVAADQMIDFALQKGGQDNVTALMVAIDELDTPHRSDGGAKAHFAQIRNMPLLQHLNDGELSRFISRTERRCFGPEQVLWSLGDAADVLYLVLEGSLELSAQHDAFGTIEPGQFVGAMTTMDGGRRPVDARVGARSSLTALALSRHSFYDIVAKDPPLGTKLLWSIGTSLATRMRRVTEQLVRERGHKQRKRPPAPARAGSDTEPCLIPFMPDDALNSPWSKRVTHRLAPPPQTLERVRSGRRKALATQPAVPTSEPIEIQDILEVIEEPELSEPPPLRIDD